MLVRLLTAILFLLPVLAWAQTKPAVAVRPFQMPAGSQGEALARTLNNIWLNQWSAEGFLVVDGTPTQPAQFQASGVFVIEGDDLVLQVAVTDAVSHAVVASDMLSIFQGLTAFDPVNRMLLGVTQRAKAYWNLIRDNPGPVPPVVEALTFLSPDNGAEVFWLGRESIGRIQDGQLTAPYFPFPSTAVLTLILEKPDYRTKVVEVPLDASTSSYTLPALEKLRTEELHVFNQLGRVMGLGVEYRRYFVPEWAFWSAEVYPFVQVHPGTRSRPVLHLDTAASVGTWIGFSADSWFRWGVQTSLGLSQTVTIGAEPAWYWDATLSPFLLLLEWRIGPVLLENRFQVPYSLGLPSGVLPATWLFVNSLPMVSVGAVLRW